MVVRAVDEGDLEAVVVGEAAGTFEPREAAADDEEFAHGVNVEPLIPKCKSMPKSC
jgi:hypothetical protein